MNAQIRELFERYERANADFDVAKIASLYADVFMFGGEQGVQAVKKDDFLKVLPRRKEFFRSIGLVSSQVEQIETTQLDSRYVLAKVVWKMQIERSGTGGSEIKTSASYLLWVSNGSFQIVFQVDHQDLAKKVKELS